MDGSGIDPLDNLDRLMLASPNLQRSRLLLAGRSVGGEASIREAVARMATARGSAAAWSTRRGVPVAPWRNADATERVIALLEPHYFTITRPEDLPRLLAVARARQAEQHAQAHTDGTPAAQSGAEALLSMGDGDAMTLEVEGARRFTRGQTRGVPERLRLAVRQIDAAHAAIDAEGTFESPEEADAARDFWSRVRDGYARNIFVAAMGLGTPLHGMHFDADGATLHVHTEIDARQLRLIFDYLEEAFRAQAREAAARSQGAGHPPDEPPAGSPPP